MKKQHKENKIRQIRTDEIESNNSSKKFTAGYGLQVRKQHKQKLKLQNL